VPLAACAQPSSPHILEALVGGAIGGGVGGFFGALLACWLCKRMGSKKDRESSR